MRTIVLGIGLSFWIGCDRPDKEYGWDIDEDGDGFTLNEDCDDLNAEIHPDAPEICDEIDNDCDELVDDEDGSLDTDTRSVWYADSDGDGFGNPDESEASCAQPADSTDNAEDCDDDNREVNPVVPEVCNEIDDDCDGLIDDEDEDVESDGFLEFHVDADGDGYGDPDGETAWSCAPSSGYSADPTDCDDADAEISPAADEVCDEIDNDCDGWIDGDDDSISYADDEIWYADSDEDGFGDFSDEGEGSCVEWVGRVQNTDDCDDTDGAVNPDAQEVCDEDDTDEDCDGLAEDDDPDNTGTTWYIDDDGDGYGIGTSSVVSCDHPGGGWVDNQEDCDDTRVDVNPDGVEQCNSGLDDDCNGFSDDSDPGLDEDTAITWYADIDSDHYGDPDNTTAACLQPTGYVSDSSDCDDRDADTNPDGFEVCGGGDEDCDGYEDDADPSISYASDESWYPDSDGDGYGDEDGTAIESCVSVTGYAPNDQDCDDGDSGIHPGATEVCDADLTDEDCDGLADDADPGGATGGYSWHFDVDGDGFGGTASGTTACLSPGTGWVDNSDDCDDADDDVHPDATEICDGEDNDCDWLTDDDDPDVDPGSFASFYGDADGDGYGSAATIVEACEVASGYTTDDTDCDDSRDDVNPGMSENEITVWDDDCDGDSHHGVTLYGSDGSTVTFSASQNNLVADDDADFVEWSLSDTDWAISTSASGYTTAWLDLDTCDSGTSTAWSCLELPTASTGVPFDECASLLVEGLGTGQTYGISFSMENADGSAHTVYLLTQTQMDEFAATGSGSYLLDQSISASSSESVVSYFEAVDGSEEIVVCYGEFGSAYISHMWVSEASAY